MASVDFSGKWKLTRSEQFEEYLQKKGVNYLMRKMAGKATPTMDITQDGDNIHIKMATGFKTEDNEFTVGTDRKYTSGLGHTYNVQSKWEDSKLVFNLQPPEDAKYIPEVVTREIIDGELVQSMEADGVLCKRIFKREA